MVYEFDNIGFWFIFNYIYINQHVKKKSSKKDSRPADLLLLRMESVTYVFDCREMATLPPRSTAGHWRASSTVDDERHTHDTSEVNSWPLEGL
jgi:hypothetical protein